MSVVLNSTSKVNVERLNKDISLFSAVHPDYIRYEHDP